MIIKLRAEDRQHHKAIWVRCYRPVDFDLWLVLKLFEQLPQVRAGAESKGGLWKQFQGSTFGADDRDGPDEEPMKVSFRDVRVMGESHGLNSRDPIQINEILKPYLPVRYTSLSY